MSAENKVKIKKVKVSIIKKNTLRTLRLCGESGFGYSPRRRGDLGFRVSSFESRVSSLNSGLETPDSELTFCDLCGESGFGHLTAEARKMRGRK